MNLPNPIPASVRGWLYIIGAGLGFVSLPVTAILALSGLSEWIPVVAVTTGGAVGFIGLLGRSNLSDPTTGATPEVPNPNTLP